MAQISIIKKSDITEAHRFDAEYFKPEYLRLEKNITKFILFGNIIDILTDGKHGGVTFANDGVLFIRNNNILNGNIETSNKKFISEEESNESKRAEITTGDILLTTIGTIGESAVVPESIKRGNINQNLVKIRLKEGYSSIFVSNFLNSKYGKFQTKRFSTGNVQLLLNYPKLKKIKIPIFLQSFQLQIEKTVKSAHQKQTLSKQLYKEAEQLLLEELGLVNYKPKHQLTFETTKKEIEEAKRFDAEYFQPKYAEIIEKIENYEGGFDVLENLTIYINNGNQPPYVETGRIRFFSQKWIKDQGIDYDFLERNDEPMVSRSFFKEEKNKSSLIKKGDILYYSVGANLGFCHSYLEDEPIAVGSFINIIRADKEKINEIFLAFTINSIIGRLQGDKEKSGIAQPYIYAKNLRKFKIPRIEPQIQTQIAEKIKESHKLRKESKELLEEAKRKVEEEIEKG